jgi:hypothetical protein
MLRDYVLVSVDRNTMNIPKAIRRPSTIQGLKPTSLRRPSMYHRCLEDGGVFARYVMIAAANR